MLKALVACIILSGSALPAVAGDRPGVASGRALAGPATASGASSPHAGPVSGRTATKPFMLPVGAARLQPLSPIIAHAEKMPKHRREAEPTAWGPGSTLPEVTARSGGSYAVYDVMDAQPRPRHRGSPLSTAFVLKLDGEDDSPAFSIGGGGVAAAVWRAVPR